MHFLRALSARAEYLSVQQCVALMMAAQHFNISPLQVSHGGWRLGTCSRVGSFVVLTMCGMVLVVRSKQNRQWEENAGGGVVW